MYNNLSIQVSIQQSQGEASSRLLEAVQLFSNQTPIRNLQIFRGDNPKVNNIFLILIFISFIQNKVVIYLCTFFFIIKMKWVIYKFLGIQVGGSHRRRSKERTFVRLYNKPDIPWCRVPWVCILTEPLLRMGPCLRPLCAS